MGSENDQRAEGVEEYGKPDQNPMQRDGKYSATVNGLKDLMLEGYSESNVCLSSGIHPYLESLWAEEIKCQQTGVAHIRR
ncbi:hypothetical protein PRK78_006974 [Emydomyces testavorans]|uniref:Uncharacterized protein n=1 Tax=Emydomyces testavorans TaxID=2070801 RepID=A0AAF0IPP4_9EURO|nr:hypothetical protein PRK78_006974 [Emydomyces testavorans]